MRFRASIENVPSFYRIIQAIEKLQKKCIIKFGEEEMSIICNNDANEGGIQVWSQIKVQSLFSGYRIQSNADNEITMSVSGEALLAALRSASSSSSASSYDTTEVVVKLAKKNEHAALSFEIAGMTGQGRLVKVAHDVRIDVMKPGDVARLKEPLCPEPDTHVILPPLQKLRTIVERMRPMSDVLAIRASNNGKLQLAISTDSVTVETQWTNCTNPDMSSGGATQSQSDDDEKPDPDDLFEVHVSTRSFLKFLNSHIISTTTIACICKDHCLILYVYVGEAADAGGVLTFYIPAIIDDD